MVEKNAQPIDVGDMALVHLAFRRGLGEARGQLGFIADGDTERAEFFAHYLADLLFLLHAHHGGEDELLYPLLMERVPEQQELWTRMEDQHGAVGDRLDAARAAIDTYGTSASRGDADAVADQCESLWGVLGPHLSQEEDEVLPWAADYITAEEWGKLPQHALMLYEGDRIWMPFGLATEAFPAEVREGIVASAPPLTAMWNGGGKDAFDNAMTLVRDEGAWASR